MNPTEAKPVESTPDSWAIVELLGHMRLGGKLTEEERFGVKLGRLDIPSGEGFVTKFFGGASVYCITVVSEEAARAVAIRTPAPVSAWELPKLALPLSPHSAKADDSLDDDDLDPNSAGDF